jgi:RNA polymerase sigma-70 factor (ECF subfamily)
MVLRRCRKLLRDEQKALDAMHDVFVNLIRARGRLSDEAPARLLLRIGTNVCLNRLRGERRHPEDADDAELLRVVAATDSSEERSLAQLILGRLLGRERATTGEIAVLHYVDRLTLEETAAEVGLSVSGVRKRLRGLRARLDDLTKERCP